MTMRFNSSSHRLAALHGEKDLSRDEWLVSWSLFSHDNSQVDKFNNQSDEFICQWDKLNCKSDKFNWQNL